MSTFDGIILEYPLISIDSFVEKNYKSTVYFLSHCHTDHMRGLKDSKFFSHLKTRRLCKILVSKVSKCLLINDGEFAHLTPYLEDLSIEDPTLISVPNEEGTEVMKISVTLLPAGHCPGSVMFFFEGYAGNVLYTGDFRLPIGASARLKNLHFGGKLKPLKSIYLDTTFCNPNSLYIPTREQCLRAILSLVKPWLDKGQDHIVYFFCPAKYAYEFVFVELYNRYGVKTHVSETKVNQFQDIHEISPAVTSISNEARIHACIFERNPLFTIMAENMISPCGYSTPDNLPIKILEIKPSAMFFTHQKYKSISHYNRLEGLHRVCYSTHSSLMEIRDMVNYLKPQNVYPNVVRVNSVQEILKWLNVPEEALSQHTERKIGNNKPFNEKKNRIKRKDFVPAPGTSKRKLNSPERGSGSGSLPFYDDIYEISPVKVATRCKEILNSEEKSAERSVLPDDVHEITKNKSTNNRSSSPLKWQYQPLSSQESISYSISCESDTCSSASQSDSYNGTSSSDSCNGTSPSDGHNGTSQSDSCNGTSQSDGHNDTNQSHEIIETCHTNITKVTSHSTVTNNSSETSVINNTLKSSLDNKMQGSSMVEGVISDSVLFPQCIVNLVSPVKNSMEADNHLKKRANNYKTTMENFRVAKKNCTKDFEDDSNSNELVVESSQEKQTLLLDNYLPTKSIVSFAEKNKDKKLEQSQEKSDLSLSDLEADDKGKLSDDVLRKQSSADSSFDLSAIEKSAEKAPFDSESVNERLKNHRDFSFYNKFKNPVERLCESKKEGITLDNLVLDNKPKHDIIDLSDDEDISCGKLQLQKNFEQKTSWNSFGEYSKYSFPTSSQSNFSHENLVTISSSSSSSDLEEDSPSLITFRSKKAKSRSRTDSYIGKRQKFSASDLQKCDVLKMRCMGDQSTPEDLLVSNTPSCQNSVRREELSPDKSTPEDLLSCPSGSNGKMQRYAPEPFDIIVLDDSL